MQKLSLIIIDHLLLINKGMKIILSNEQIAIFKESFQLYNFEIPQPHWKAI